MGTKGHFEGKNKPPSFDNPWNRVFKNGQPKQWSVNAELERSQRSSGPSSDPWWRNWDDWSCKYGEDVSKSSCSPCSGARSCSEVVYLRRDALSLFEIERIHLSPWAWITSTLSQVTVLVNRKYICIFINDDYGLYNLFPPMYSIMPWHGNRGFPGLRFKRPAGDGEIRSKVGDDTSSSSP